MLDSTHDLLKSPESSKSSTPETQMPTKKISLKRNTSIEPSGEKSSDSSTEPEKKVIKLTQLTEQERLDLRAKKFAGNGSASASSVGSQDNLSARAARFGMAELSASSTTKTVTAVISDEVLKKRAERFGPISKEVKNAELEEKLQKRKDESASVHELDAA